MGSTKNLDLYLRRKNLGLTQRPIAEALGCSISAVSDFENDERAGLPHGKGRSDYERVLMEFEAKRQASVA